MLMMVAKIGISTIAGLGASTVVANAVLATTPANLTRVGRAMVVIGGSVIGGVVGGEVYAWTWEQVESIEEGIDNIKKNHRVRKENKQKELRDKTACKGIEA